MCKRRNQLSVGASIKRPLQQVKTFAKNVELETGEDRDGRTETETDTDMSIQANWLIYKSKG